MEDLFKQIESIIKNNCDGTFSDDPSKWNFSESEGEPKKVLDDIKALLSTKLIISDDELRQAAKVHGTRTIKGNVPWDQRQQGDKADSFTAGAKHILQLISK